MWHLHFFTEADHATKTFGCLVGDRWGHICSRALWALVSRSLDFLLPPWLDEPGARASSRVCHWTGSVQKRMTKEWLLVLWRSLQTSSPAHQAHFGFPIRSQHTFLTAEAELPGRTDKIGESKPQTCHCAGGEYGMGCHHSLSCVLLFCRGQAVLTLASKVFPLSLPSVFCRCLLEWTGREMQFYSNTCFRGFPLSVGISHV